jgi:mannose-6-phosphate isomerase-like protein (cupin superfamily)
MGGGAEAGQGREIAVSILKVRKRTMHEIERRTFLGVALAGLPLTLFGQESKAPNASRAIRIGAGQDRFGKDRTRGVSSSAYKVSGQDSSGQIFVMENANVKKGGSPRHLHHNENELFYVLEGEYIVEVGTERFHLTRGDCVFAPREIPHLWAFVGNTPGKMLVSFAPAGRMEEFFAEHDKRGSAYITDAALYRAYGLELIGPPLSVD